MEDIARSAGLSKGSLYHHFDSKTQLFFALIEDLIAEASAAFEAIAPDKPVAPAIREVVARVLRENDDVARRAMFEFIVLASREPELRDRFHKQREVELGIIRRAISAGVERGEFRADLDVERAARVMSLAPDGMVYMSLVVGPEYADDDDVLAMLDILLQSFAAPSKES